MLRLGLAKVASLGKQALGLGSDVSAGEPPVAMTEHGTPVVRCDSTNVPTFTLFFSITKRLHENS